MQTLPRLSNVLSSGKLQTSITRHDHREMSLFSSLASRVLYLTHSLLLPCARKAHLEKKVWLWWLWQAGSGWSAQFRERSYLSPKTLSLWASALFWLWLTWDFPRLGSDWGTGFLALVQEHEALPENSSVCRPRRPWSAWTFVSRMG